MTWKVRLNKKAGQLPFRTIQVSFNRSAVGRERAEWELLARILGLVSHEGETSHIQFDIGGVQEDRSCPLDFVLQVCHPL